MTEVKPDTTALSLSIHLSDSSTERREYRKREEQADASTGDIASIQTRSWPLSSSNPLPDGQALIEVLEQFRRLFRAGRYEEFETGTESHLARGIQELVRQHPGAGPDAVRQLILEGKVETEAAWEALRWLGCMEHLPSRAARLWVLEQCLQSPSAKVRDGAALGLAAVDDPHAIPALRVAVPAERIPELREDLLHVLHQLESTARCPSS